MQNVHFIVICTLDYYILDQAYSNVWKSNLWMSLKLWNLLKPIEIQKPELTNVPTYTATLPQFLCPSIRPSRTDIYENCWNTKSNENFHWNPETSRAVMRFKG